MRSRASHILMLVLGIAIGSGLTAVVLTRVAPAPVPVAAKPPPAPEIIAAYDAINKLPVWNGAWEPDAHPSILETDEAIPLTPKYAAKLAALRKAIKAGGKLPGNPECRPQGVPLFMERAANEAGPLMEVLYRPGQVIFTSGSLESRIVNTDGRTLKDPDIDYFDGTAVGHWEHGTSANYVSVLVIDTIGIVADADVFPGIANDGNLHVSERIQLANQKLQDEITLTNPEMFTKPYTYTRTFTRHSDWDVSEYVCLRDVGTDYGVGPKPTPDEEAASTTAKPPVRQKAEPAANAATLPGGSWINMPELPDWGTLGGLWRYDNRPIEVDSDEAIPLTPDFAKKLAELRALGKTGGDVPSDVYHCRPRGPAQIMKGAATNFYVMFSPGEVAIVPEYPGARRIYTDGRKHPDHVELSFMGHSIGHWEGDTLVADTVGLRPDVQMFYGMPSGGGMHMAERIRKTGPAKLQIDTTMTAPAALASPWSYTRTYTYRKDWVSMENYCTQNNRDVNPGSGMQQFNKTPPPETP